MASREGAAPPPFVLKPGRDIVDSNGGKWQATAIKDMASAVNWFKSKMMDGHALASAPDGYYTYIIKCDRLAVMPVLSNQEVGSVHVNMWSWTSHCIPDRPTPADVTAAGEIQKIGQIIQFNLKSGTFMQHRFRVAGANSITIASRLADTVSASLSAFPPLQPQFLRCDPCTQDYETVSGKSILDTANIVTSSHEMFFLKHIFVLKNRDPLVSIENANLAKLFENTVKIGGAQKRHRRKQRQHGRRRKTLRHKNTQSHTRRRT